MTEASRYMSPVGLLTIAADSDGLIGLWIKGQKHFPSNIDSLFSDDSGNEVLNETRLWLDRYFAGQKPLPSELPLAPIGSDFQKDTWKILCGIPYGKTMTYGAIAKAIANSRGMSSMSARAVGGAIGHNPISIIIPCHRVIGANGSLTGYAGGLEVKKQLLAMESVSF